MGALYASLCASDALSITEDCLKAHILKQQSFILRGLQVGWSGFISSCGSCGGRRRVWVSCLHVLHLPWTNRPARAWFCNAGNRSPRRQAYFKLLIASCLLAFQWPKEIRWPNSMSDGQTQCQEAERTARLHGEGLRYKDREKDGFGTFRRLLEVSNSGDFGLKSSLKNL